MFIGKSRGGYRGTEQVASGHFLMVFQNENAPRLENKLRPLRALVRKVALHQCGHFMMGSVKLYGVRFSLSGTYGSDGLPMEITHSTRRNVPERPDEFTSPGEHQAYYAAVDKIPWERIELAPGLWERLHPLPDDLVERFWSSSDGHNGAGSEGSSMHDWALENLDTLRRFAPKK